MSKHELCPTCRELGNKCQFEKLAKDIAIHVPPLEKQTPITPGNKATKEALLASELIAKHRQEARDLLCPKTNSVYPNFPGRKNL